MEKINSEEIEQIVNNAAESIIIVNRKGVMIFINHQVECFFGYIKDELIGQPIEILIPKSLQKKHAKLREQYVLDPIARPMGRGLQLFGRHKSGHDLPVDISLTPLKTHEGGLLITVIIHDVSEHQQLEETLTKKAYYDRLTNLLSRDGLFEKINYAIDLAKRIHQVFAIFYIDLDNFKNINDTYGHLVGDLLLQAVAHRFIKNLRAIDVISRMGGDEFVCILSDITYPTDVILLVEKVQQLFVKPFEINHQSIRITASIGISLFPKDGSIDKVLLEKADQAMYRAKHKGKNQFVFYEQEHC